MHCPNCGAPSNGVCRYCKAVSNLPAAGPQGPESVLDFLKAERKAANEKENNLILGMGCLVLVIVIAVLTLALVSGWDTFWPAFWRAFGNAGPS
jgi:hypothetical protein